MEKYPGLTNVYYLPEMLEQRHVFSGRSHAGEILSDMVRGFENRHPLILAIPAGGVPVAAVVARQLGLDCDLAIVSKITLPWNTEAGYGAVAFDGTTRLNRPLTEKLQLGEAIIQEGIRRTTEKVDRRSKALRGEKPFPDLTGKTVILVDDGLASGFTLLVAVEALSKQLPKEIFVAVPTGQLRSIEKVSNRVSRLFCPNIRSGAVFAVADAYERWSDVSEDVVLALMDKRGEGH